MVVALPLIDRVAGVEVAALAAEPGCVGDAPDVPDDVPDEVVDELPEVPDEVLAVADVALGALVWTATPAGEHPKSVTDETNTPMMALEILMDSSWSSASRMSLDGDSSIVTERSGIPTGT